MLMQFTSLSDVCDSCILECLVNLYLYNCSISLFLLKTDATTAGCCLLCTFCIPAGQGMGERCTEVSHEKTDAAVQQRIRL